MKAYKGFTKEMKCRDFQYEEGGEYEQEGGVKVCEKGFHACEYPLDCLRYYAPANSEYHEVELGGELSQGDDDTKVAASKIKIGARLDIVGLVNASFEYIKENANKTKSNHSKADKRVNSATGDWSANSATGYGSANISTGLCCKNEAAGSANISVGWGKDNKCKGCIGSYLVLSEWGEWDGEKYPFIGAQMVKVDGEMIKADTWYMLNGGNIIEVE